MQKFSLDSFKDAIKSGDSSLSILMGPSDVIDFDNGSAIIHRRNLNKYLEQYLCKTEADLEDTLWYNYGVFVKIVD